MEVLPLRTAGKTVHDMHTDLDYAPTVCQISFSVNLLNCCSRETQVP